MNMINKKNLLTIFAFTLLFVVAVISGIYIAQHSHESLNSPQNISQSSDNEDNTKDTSTEDENLYNTSPSSNNNNNNNNNDSSTKVIESQKLLLSKKENIRVRMNNQIAAIRDKQTREDIAYKEGFLSIQKYFTQKAQNEADIQQIRLNYANEEINAIKNTLFNSVEEKNIEINTATAKKNRIEQELSTAHKAQEEVANVIASYDRAMEQ